MKKLIISEQGQRYGLDGTSFFQDIDGTEYSITRDSGMELVGLLLEALGMDVCERDDLLERLEEKELDRRCNALYGFEDWSDGAA